MSPWLLALLAAVHAAAGISLLMDGRYGLALVMAGGMIVQMLAIEHPDRLRSVTSVMTARR